jgi:AcrR family transcriptional regulator
MNVLNDVCPDSLRSGRGKGRDGADSVDFASADQNRGSGGLDETFHRMSIAETPPSGGPPRAPTRRALAKQQTRSRILDAARRLFSEHGYEGATIRDIAAAASMSTGAVFANFADKYDLFHEILELEAESAVEIMQTAVAGGATVDDTLQRMFRASFVHLESMLPLARAAFAVAVSAQGPAMAGAECFGEFIRLFREPLDAAVARGELRADTDVQLLNEMLWETYLGNILKMIYQGAPPEVALERARLQVAVLLAGVRQT